MMWRKLGRLAVGGVVEPADASAKRVTAARIASRPLLVPLAKVSSPSGAKVAT
jgi:hypothetical protein